MDYKIYEIDPNLTQYKQDIELRMNNYNRKKAQLLADGYDGYFSFEWEKKWVPDLEEPEIAFPAYAEYMRNL